MSDKKEIATLSIKISVDSTDLDKLELQLKRIEGLMVSTGLKQQSSGGFSADFAVFNPRACLEPVFTVSSGVAYINEACIEKATLEKAMIQAAKEGAKKGAEQAWAEITTGINDNREQVSAEVLPKSSAEIAETSATGILDRISETLHNSGNKAVIAAQDKAIDINPPVSREELKKHKQYVEAGLDEMQSQLIGFQHALVASEQSTAQHLSGLQRQITQLNKQLEDARCKESINNMSIISLKQTIEQQEKLMIQTIKSVIAEDVARGGPLCRALR